LPHRAFTDGRPQRRLIDDVVVHERRHVHHLDDDGEADVAIVAVLAPRICDISRRKAGRSRLPPPSNTCSPIQSMLPTPQCSDARSSCSKRASLAPMRAQQ
jgi:hypothetical protein